MRPAPSREAARTAESPTAPSPTTATVSPSCTPALTAAWWPVLITSESVSSDRRVASSWPEPGTGTNVPDASGTRTASPWPPSMVPLPKVAPCTQAIVAPWRQCGQVPSLTMNGAMTRSPTATPVTSDPTASTTPMNSWPIDPTACSVSPR